MSSSPTAPSSALTANLARGDRSSATRRAVLGAFTAMSRGHLVLELPDGTVHEQGSRTDAPAHALPLGIPAHAHLRVRREVFFKKCFWSGDIGFEIGRAHV